MGLSATRLGMDSFRVERNHEQKHEFLIKRSYFALRSIKKIVKLIMLRNQEKLYLR